MSISGREWFWLMEANSKKLALDTNVVLDLASGSDAVHDFRETFQRRGYALFLPPTVIEELAYQRLEEAVAKAALAARALASLRIWKLVPLPPSSLGRAIARQFARRLIEKRLLASEEVHDGMILAETSAAGIPVLVSADNHLLGIDELALHLACNEADLDRVVVMHPRNMLRALR